MEYTTVHYNTYMLETQALLPSPGLLLVAAGKDGKPNAMAIGWGTIGFIWGKPIFATLVRPSRYTYTLLEENDSFTVCVPARVHKKLIGFCGTKSGRDVDKFKECNMEVLPSMKVSAPGIAGFPLIYECQIVHTNDIIPANLTDEIKSSAYPQGDFHRVYYGEILAVRAVPDAAELLRY